jgi:hypothetical protein
MTPAPAVRLALLVAVTLAAHAGEAAAKPKAKPKEVPLTAVRTEHGYQYIDPQGVAVLKGYTDASPFSEGVAFVRAVDGPQTIIDGTGAVLATLPEDMQTGRDFHDGLAAVTKRGSSGTGFIDTHGALVIPYTLPSGSGDFHDGVAVVSQGDLQGFLDRTGKLVVPVECATVGQAGSGLVPVQRERRGKYGYLRRDGSVAIPAKYAAASGFSDDLAWVSEDGEKFGVIDPRGAWVIEPRYAAFRGFVDGLAPVYVSDEPTGGKWDGGAWTLIDRKGKVQYPPTWFWAGDLGEGLLCVATKANHERYGLADRKGKLVVPATFEQPLVFEHGLAQVRGGAKTSYLNAKGRIVYTEP